MPDKKSKVESGDFEKSLSSRNLKEPARSDNTGFFNKLFNFLKQSFKDIKATLPTIFRRKTSSTSQDSSKESDNNSKDKSDIISKNKSKSNSQSKSRLGAIGSGLGKVVSTITNSNVFKFITSPIVSRIVTVAFAVTGITLAALALSGVGIGAAASLILAPPVAIPLAAITIGTVAIAAGIDAFMVGRTRSLHSESKYLSRHRLAKDVQDKILSKDPKLSKVLQEELYTPEREGKKSLKDRYTNSSSKTKSVLASIALGAGTTVLNYAVPLVEGIISRNPIKIVKVVASSVYGVSSYSSSNMTMSAKRDEFRGHIDKLRDNHDSPGYNNIKELKISAREQKIQSLALQELVKDPSYPNYTEAQIKEKFINIKEKIQNTEKSIQSHYAVTNVIKDIVIAHNPFSKYNDPKKLTTKLENTQLKINESRSKIVSKKVKLAAKNLVSKVVTSKQKKKDKFVTKKEDSRGR
jgi:hypothetical protein